MSWILRFIVGLLVWVPIAFLAGLDDASGPWPFRFIVGMLAFSTIMRMVNRSCDLMAERKP